LLPGTNRRAGPTFADRSMEARVPCLLLEPTSPDPADFADQGILLLSPS